MYVQYSEGFPGAVVEDNRIYVDTAKDFQKPLEELYAAYLENNADKFPISPDYAAGLYAFLAQPKTYRQWRSKGMSPGRFPGG